MVSDRQGWGWVECWVRDRARVGPQFGLGLGLGLAFELGFLQPWSSEKQALSCIMLRSTVKVCFQLSVHLLTWDR